LIVDPTPWWQLINRQPGDQNFRNFSLLPLLKVVDILVEK